MGGGLRPPCPRIVRGQQYLTLEQAAYAHEFARERIAAMLSTESIDEQEAERHLCEVYRADKREPPATICWLDSPLSFVLASIRADVLSALSTYCYHTLLQKMRTIDAIQVMDQYRIGESMRDRKSIHHYYLSTGFYRIEASVRRSVETSLLNNVRTIMDREMAKVERQIVGCLLDNERASMEVNTTGALTESVMRSVRGYVHVNLLSCYRFLSEVFEENKLIHLARLNELVSGYWLGEKEAWLVRKPVLLHRDEQGQLHNASGPCIQYRDGWGVYAWHGVRVPEKLILHPEQMTREEWLQEPNAEVRRVIQERLGNERFIEMVGGKQIDAGRRGKLIEIDLGRGDPERVAHYVQVQDSSTQRQYYLRVPPSITTADEAIAWTFGLDARDYQPGQET